MKKKMMCLRSAVLVGLVFLFAVGLIGTYVPDEALAQLRPAIVKDVENPDKQVIYNQYNLQATIDAGSRVAQVYSDFVPAGKRWVIEHMSALANMPTEGQVPMVRFNVTSLGSASFVHYLPMGYQGGDFDIVSYRYVWMGSQATKLRLEPGTRILFQFRRTGTTDTATLTIHISGYLVDYP